MADALRPAGRLVVAGKAGAEVGALRVQSLYWKQLDVLGSSMGSPADFTAYLDHVVTAAWSPRVDSVYPLERVVDGYQRLDAPSRVGKVVLDTRTVGATRPLTRGQLDPPIHHVDTWSP